MYHVVQYIPEDESEVAQLCPTLCNLTDVAYQAPLSMGLYVPSTYLSYNWKSVPFGYLLPTPLLPNPRLW